MYILQLLRNIKSYFSGDQIPPDFYLSDLHKQLTSCLGTKPSEVTSARPIVNPGTHYRVRLL